MTFFFRDSALASKTGKKTETLESSTDTIVTVSHPISDATTEAHEK